MGPPFMLDRYTKNKQYRDSMIIDAHAHACGDFLNGKNVIKILNKNNVDKVILVPGELGSNKNYFLPELAAKFPNTDVVSITNIITKLVIGISGTANQIGEGNAYVYSLAKEYPDRIIQFYWVRLSQSTALEDLERHYTEYGFRGIKLHQCWESFKINSDIFHKISEWTVSKGLPIFVHLYTKRQATQLAKYIKEHPNTIFIIGHLFGLERYIKADINTDNVFFEISTPQLISIKRLLKALKHFGPNRIILGSDIPYGQNNLNINIERVKKLNITSKERDLILGGNIKKLLKI
jgi:predicted TIM-barrel fold metal-dependent hydrolase